MACTLNYLPKYENYSTEEKKILGIHLEDEGLFLIELKNRMNDLDNANILYTSWDVNAKIMSFEIYSAEGVFNEQHICAIVTVLADVDGSSKFNYLRRLGWCSGYDLSGCVKERIEFNWFNPSKNCTHKDNAKIVNIDYNTCACMICNYRFNDNV